MRPWLAQSIGLLPQIARGVSHFEDVLVADKLLRFEENVFVRDDTAVRGKLNAFLSPLL